MILFHRIGPLGRFDLVVAMSVCLMLLDVPFHVLDFEAYFAYFWFLCILGPPYCGIGATIRIGREILCLPYAGFFCV